MKSVKQVVDSIAAKYPKRIVFALNSASEVKCNQFKDRKGLFNALTFLARDFRDAKMGTRACPDLDDLCRQKSGFSYVPHQSVVTLGLHPHEYRTVFRGRTLWLRSHLRKGAGSDPRTTIRVGFDYLDDAKLVVVGYIGKHQTNQHS